MASQKKFLYWTGSLWNHRINLCIELENNDITEEIFVLDRIIMVSQE